MPAVGGTQAVTEGLTLVFGATCPGDHRPLLFLIRYGDAGTAVTLRLSVPAPEPGEEGGFLYGAGSRCPVPPGPSGLQTLGRVTPGSQQAGEVTRLRRPGGFSGEPVCFQA